MNRIKKKNCTYTGSCFFSLLLLLLDGKYLQRVILNCQALETVPGKKVTGVKYIFFVVAIKLVLFEHITSTTTGWMLCII